MARPINYVLDISKAYAGVQSQLLGLIDAQLPEPRPTRGEYRKGALNFALFIREPADVVMSHGVADKSYFWTADGQGRKFVNSRQHVLVPGEWLKRRLLSSKPIRLTEEQIHVVGWPRLDELIGQVPAPAARRFGSSKPRVLWAPTHNKRVRGETSRSTSSYPAFENYLRALSRFAWVDVSVHPRNRKDRTPTGASMPRSDIVVADFGTTVYEAWALGKPVIFPRWLLADRIAEYLPGSAEAHIFRERIGYHPDSFDEMVDIIRAGPVITPDVRMFMDDYLEPAYYGRSSARVAEVLTQLAAAD
jgi:CDP-glycerol glycerophosphotransferase (TagB/SpsB family)